MLIDCKISAGFLDDEVRNPFVSGLFNKAIQSHLLPETDLNLHKS